MGITHVLRAVVEWKGNHRLSEKIKGFWGLDTIAIVEKGKSVSEKFLDNISFHDNRYEVRLPFKEDHPVTEENYELCKKRLPQLMKQLDNNQNLKKNIMTLLNRKKYRI